MSRYNYSNYSFVTKKLSEMERMSFREMALHCASLASAYSCPDEDSRRKKFNEMRAAFHVLERKSVVVTDGGSLFSKLSAKKATLGPMPTRKREAQEEEISSACTMPEAVEEEISSACTMPEVVEEMDMPGNESSDKENHGQMSQAT
jgi:hypothetical protein